jgi:hypothetical protein
MQKKHFKSFKINSEMPIASDANASLIIPLVYLVVISRAGAAGIARGELCGMRIMSLL